MRLLNYSELLSVSGGNINKGPPIDVNRSWVPSGWDIHCESGWDFGWDSGLSGPQEEYTDVGFLDAITNWFYNPGVGFENNKDRAHKTERGGDAFSVLRASGYGWAQFADSNGNGFNVRYAIDNRDGSHWYDTDCNGLYDLRVIEYEGRLFASSDGSDNYQYEISWSWVGNEIEFWSGTGRWD
jgi:hypothetical protein